MATLEAPLTWATVVCSGATGATGALVTEVIGVVATGVDAAVLVWTTTVSTEGVVAVSTGPGAGAEWLSVKTVVAAGWTTVTTEPPEEETTVT